MAKQENGYYTIEDLCPRFLTATEVIELQRTESALGITYEVYFHGGDARTAHDAVVQHPDPMTYTYGSKFPYRFTLIPKHLNDCDNPDCMGCFPVE